MSDIQEQIKIAHKRAEENDIKLLQEENKRLNNIIDELEKYAKEEIYYGNKNPEHYKKIGIEDYIKGQIVAMKHILNKLNELKGDNK